MTAVQRTPPDTLWRCWQVLQGDLVAPFAQYGSDLRGLAPWPRTGSLVAVCLWPGRDHAVPAAGCECGVRGMERLDELLEVMARARLLFTAPSVVGTVALSGRVLGPSAADPPRTWRGERAELVGPLYASPLVGAPATAALSRSYGRPLQPWWSRPRA